MKEKIYIMMVGLPASGKTTSTRALQVYFSKEKNMKCVVSNKVDMRSRLLGNPLDQSRNRDIARLHLNNIRKWRTGEIDADVFIDNNVNLNVFKRLEALKLLRKDFGEDSEQPYICAIYMRRTYSFCRMHNLTRTDGKSVPESVIDSMENHFQQPLLQEGFHHVFKVKGNDRLIPNKWYTSFCKSKEKHIDV